MVSLSDSNFKKYIVILSVGDTKSYLGTIVPWVVIGAMCLGLGRVILAVLYLDLTFLNSLNTWKGISHDFQINDLYAYVTYRFFLIFTFHYFCMTQDHP